MRLYDLLRLREPSFDPVKAKIHLARWNGIEQPIHVWQQGGFDEWQRWQTKPNFERDLVVALVQVPMTYRWMFAGLFDSKGHTIDRSVEHRAHYYYRLERYDSTAELEGRLFLTGNYTSRMSYLRGETLVEDMEVYELLPERLSVGQFPGYKQLNISKADLDLLVRHSTASWRTALASVKGIYLITDTKTGKLYVGKADGETGIWGRWCQYAATGHGNNKALLQELGREAGERQHDLRFSLLEIADLQSAPGEIERRETHWKEILQSRLTGYNRN